LTNQRFCRDDELETNWFEMDKIMSIHLRLASGFLCLLAGATGVQAQTVLFDFQNGAQGWGSFGAITTDSGVLAGSAGLGRFHSADFSVPDAGNFGIVDVSPSGQNLSSYGGLSVDARFVDVSGFEPFVGVRELDIVVATGSDATEEEFFAPKQTMDDTFFNTFAVPFSQFKSSIDQQRPTVDELANVRIKFVVLNTNGTGTARLDYDEVTGLAPVGVPGDYNNNGAVDAADYVLWRKGEPLQNEVDTPGTINAADYTAWRARFGNIAGAGSIVGNAVPEPGAGVLLLPLTLVGALALRRRAG
jgi:hypothetical protein